jgi:hypothetical protein
MSEAQQAPGLALLFREGSWRYYPDAEDVDVTSGDDPAVLVWDERDITDELTGVIGWAQVHFIENPASDLSF